MHFCKYIHFCKESMERHDPSWNILLNCESVHRTSHAKKRQRLRTTGLLQAQAKQWGNSFNQALYKSTHRQRMWEMNQEWLTSSFVGCDLVHLPGNNSCRRAHSACRWWWWWWCSVCSRIRTLQTRLDTTEHTHTTRLLRSKSVCCFVAPRSMLSPFHPSKVFCRRSHVCQCAPRPFLLTKADTLASLGHDPTPLPPTHLPLPNSHRDADHVRWGHNLGIFFDGSLKIRSLSTLLLLLMQYW